MPWFLNMTRCACRLTFDRGRGIGGITVVLRISDTTQRQRESLALLLEQSITKLDASEDQSSITRSQIWETDREISDQRTPERVLRGGADKLIDCAIVLHCPSIEIARAMAKKLRESVRAPSGVSLDGPHIYTFLHSLSVAG